MNKYEESRAFVMSHATHLEQLRNFGYGHFNDFAINTFFNVFSDRLV